MFSKLLSDPRRTPNIDERRAFGDRGEKLADAYVKDIGLRWTARIPPRNAASTLHSTQNSTTNLHCRHAVIERIFFHSLESNIFAPGDELLFGHFYVAVFDGVAFREPSRYRSWF